MTPMANNTQRDELHKTIWAIADSLRGAVGGWEFKAYVLGTIFYRYISENITRHINQLQAEACITGYYYAQETDENAEEAREGMVAEKGYFILLSQLFQNVARHPEKDVNLNVTLNNIFNDIEASAKGKASEDDMRGLFSDFAVNNSQLGNTVALRNKTRSFEEGDERVEWKKLGEVGRMIRVLSRETLDFRINHHVHTSFHTQHESSQPDC